MLEYDMSKKSEIESLEETLFDLGVKINEINHKIEWLAKKLNKIERYIEGAVYGLIGYFIFLIIQKFFN